MHICILTLFKVDNFNTHIYIYIYDQPPAIIRQLPKSINHRISNLSSDQQTFSSSAPTYENALRRSNYDFNLQYNATPSSKLTTPTLRVVRPANRNAKDTETYYGLTHLTAKTY